MGAVTSVDPRTGAIVETVAEQTDASEVARICSAAVDASAALQELTLSARAALLEAMAQGLERERDRLVDIADRESALGRARLDGEVTRTAGQLRLFSTVLRDGAFLEATIDHAAGATPDLRRLLVGLGPVAVYGASNFPFAFSAAGGDTASALAAGCAVVVKAHGAHPALDSAVVAILRDVCVDQGLTPHTISIVFGREAGTAVVADPRIQAVGFTGSENAGRLLMDIAAARPQPIPVYAEMGSLNPLMVSEAAAARGAQLATTIADSILLGGGQFCTKPGVVFVPTGEQGDALVAALTSRLSEAGSTYLLSVAIRDTFVERVGAIASTTLARVLVEPTTSTGSSATAALNEVDLADLFGDRRLVEECFGPGALVVRYSAMDALTTSMARLPSSLTVSVFADADETDFIRTISAVARAGAGRLIFNAVSTGVAVSWAQHHGGPYPASSNGMHTSVGASAIRRFLRPVAYQSFPDALLPEALQEANPLDLPRRVDGALEVGAQ